MAASLSPVGGAVRTSSLYSRSVSHVGVLTRVLVLLETGHLISQRALSEKKYSDALAEAKTVVASNAASLPGHFLTGVGFSATNAIDEAIGEFQEVLRLSPAAVQAPVELARLYLAKGDNDGAIQFAQQAIKAQP